MVLTTPSRLRLSNKHAVIRGCGYSIHHWSKFSYLFFNQYFAVTLFRFILHQAKFRLLPNRSEKCDYIQNLEIDLQSQTDIVKILFLLFFSWIEIKTGYFPLTDMPPLPLRNGGIFMKGAECAEQNGRGNKKFYDFYFLSYHQRLGLFFSEKMTLK